MRSRARAAKPLAAVIALLGIAFSAPALACMCSCSISSSRSSQDTAALEARASKFEQVYAGLIISTERIRATREVSPYPEVEAVDPGYWIESKVLVLRIWRGTPPMVAEVWTRVSTSCDLEPFPGLYFVASTNREAGRNVTEYTYCTCALRAFATEGPAEFATRGIATLGAILGLGIVASVWLLKMVRRRRPPTAKA